MDIRTVLLNSLTMAYSIFDGVLNDVPADVMDKKLPDWNINAPSAIATHIVFSEDFIVNGMIRGQAPLFASGGFAEKLGQGMPSGPQDLFSWVERVQPPFAALSDYMLALRESTKSYISAASDAELERVVQGPVGSTTVAGVLGGLLCYHTAGHTGEIAALKGVQGLKGLPF